MTDDDDTPPIRQLTDEERAEHFAEYEPGTPVVRKEIAMSSHDAECNLRHERCETSRKSQTRTLWGIALALFSGLITVTIWGADRISTSSERAGEQKAEIRSLQKQLDDLIVRVNKFAIVDPKAISIVQDL